MNIKRIILSSVAVFATAVSIVACGGGGDGTAAATAPTPAQFANGTRHVWFSINSLGIEIYGTEKKGVVAAQDIIIKADDAGEGEGEGEAAEDVVYTAQSSVQCAGVLKSSADGGVEYAFGAIYYTLCDNNVAVIQPMYGTESSEMEDEKILIALGLLDKPQADGDDDEDVTILDPNNVMIIADYNSMTVTVRATVNAPEKDDAGEPTGKLETMTISNASGRLHLYDPN